MRLEKIMNNFHRINMNGKVLYFSYETLIAIEHYDELFITENEWSNTTGKHLNYINDDKSIRMPYSKFVDLSHTLLK